MAQPMMSCVVQNPVSQYCIDTCIQSPEMYTRSATLSGGHHKNLKTPKRETTVAWDEAVAVREDRMSNASDVAQWEAYAGRLVNEGKESTTEHQEVMRRLHEARLCLAGEERYLRQRKVEGDKEWARLLAMVDSGQHPSNVEVADALFQYGLEPASEAARFVARRTVRDIDPPEKRGRKKMPTPDEASLRWLYREELSQLQALCDEDPATYAEKHHGMAPHEVAVQHVASLFQMNPRVMERLRKK